MKSMLNIKGCSLCIPCEKVKLVFQTEAQLYTSAVRNFNLHDLNVWWGYCCAMSQLGFIDDINEQAKRYQETNEMIHKYMGDWEGED